MGDRNSGENSDVVVRAVSTEGDEEDDHYQEEDLKRMISSHPLFGLLIESHINCLTVFSFSFFILFSLLYLAFVRFSLFSSLI